MKTLCFITSNAGKILEAKQKLSVMGIDVIQKNLGYPEIQAINLEDVAVYGVKHVQKIFNQPFILEDAGLFIDGLDGFPGVFSAYVFHTIGCEGILKLLEDLTDKTQRKAVFRSVYAYGEPDKKPRLFLGECVGVISHNIIGDHGFGYDPIFVPDGHDRTFAQMDADEKNCYSHRGKALDKLLDFFKKQ